MDEVVATHGATQVTFSDIEAAASGFAFLLQTECRMQQMVDLSDRMRAGWHSSSERNFFFNWVLEVSQARRDSDDRRVARWRVATLENFRSHSFKLAGSRLQRHRTNFLEWASELDTATRSAIAVGPPELTQHVAYAEVEAALTGGAWLVHSQMTRPPEEIAAFWVDKLSDEWPSIIRSGCEQEVLTSPSWWSQVWNSETLRLSPDWVRTNLVFKWLARGAVLGFDTWWQSIVTADAEQLRHTASTHAQSTQHPAPRGSWPAPTSGGTYSSQPRSYLILGPSQSTAFNQASTTYGKFNQPF